MSTRKSAQKGVTCKPISKHAKSRTGCQRCKKRHIKCDETEPQCLQCIKKNFECPGYGKPMTWSTKYEKIDRRPSTNQDSVEDWFVAEAQKLAAAISPAAASSSTALQYRAPDQMLERIRMDMEQRSTPDSCRRDPPGTSPTPTENGASASTETKEKSPPFPRPLSPVSLLGDDFILDETCTPDLLDVEQVLMGSNDQVGQTAGGTALSWPYRKKMQSIHSTDLTNLMAAFDILPSLPRQLAPDQTTMLVDHYFLTVCRINCCFDSESNPFRKDVAALRSKSRLIHHCLLSMSASHRYQGRETALVVRQYQARALSSLASFKTPGGAFRQEDMMEVLFGIIMLGISSTWNDPSAWTSSSLSNFECARALFQARVNECGRQSLRDISFLSGAMAYWELLVAFLVDQPSSSLDYLAPFTQQLSKPVHPNSWTGIATPLFIHFAGLAQLLRRKRSLSRSKVQQREPQSELILEAAIIEAKIFSFSPPRPEDIEETGDDWTSVRDLEKMAAAYRLAALLELYRAFPELRKSDVNIQTDRDSAEMRRLYFDLAVGILDLLSYLPAGCGANNIISLPLLIAGSALKPVSDVSIFGSDLDAHLDSINRGPDVVERWRSFVRQKVIDAYKVIRVESVRHIARIVEETWCRIDRGHEVHWMDVMMDKKLETYLG